MEQFEKWFEETYPLPRTMERGPISRDMKAACKAAYRTALEWVLNLCPTNENATFANQGQGMDGFSELANYKQMSVLVKKELGDT